MVPPTSDRVPRAPPYSGHTLEPYLPFAYRTFTFSGRPSQTFRLNRYLTPTHPQLCLRCTYYLPYATPVGYHTYEIWAPPLSLAATRRISSISLPRVTEMVHFTRFALYASNSRRIGFPIRTSTGQRSLAAHRRFSQPATSFFASRCLGIHRAPFIP